MAQSAVPSIRHDGFRSIESCSPSPVNRQIIIKDAAESPGAIFCVFQRMSHDLDLPSFVGVAARADRQRTALRGARRRSSPPTAPTPSIPRVRIHERKGKDQPAQPQTRLLARNPLPPGEEGEQALAALRRFGCRHGRALPARGLHGRTPGGKNHYRIHLFRSALSLRG